MNTFLPVALGAFIASYFQNKTVRESIDKAVQGLLGHGIDALNGLTRPQGGEPVESDQEEK